MKKLLIIILIGGGIFVYINKEEYVPKINEQLDIFVPESIQESISSVWSSARDFWSVLSEDIDTQRESLKQWSLDESITLIEEVSSDEYIPATKSFSPILDNSAVIFSPDSSLVQKLYAAFLFTITLLFWNFTILLVWVGIIIYYLLKGLKKKYFPKHRQSFFDKIQEKVARNDDRDEDW